MKTRHTEMRRNTALRAGLVLAAATASVLVAGCQGVTPLGREFYSVTAPTTDEAVRAGQAYCRKLAPSSFTVRTVSRSEKDPSQVEVVFRCQELNKPLPESHYRPNIGFIQGAE